MKCGGFACILLASGIAVPAWGDIITLASFDGANGSGPDSNLVLSGGTLYGQTGAGGSNNDGVIFSLPVTGGTADVLTSFNGSNGLGGGSDIALSGSTLYATTYQGDAKGNVISEPLTGGAPTVLATFLTAPSLRGNPNGLLLSGNALYINATTSGGTDGGVLYSLPLTGGTLTALATFTTLASGIKPIGSLAISGNTVYGTTYLGGEVNHKGVVFSASTTGNSSTVLAEFNGTNGTNPYSGVILSGNTLYGTTISGGANNEGEVFSIPTTGGPITVLASFNGTDGASPFGALIISGDTLYGTTGSGGADSDGVIFSLPITGGTPTILASFDGTDGQVPGAALLLSDHILYGTTTQGGANGDGVVFALAVPEPTCLSLLTLSSIALLQRRRGRMPFSLA